jgi:outer membrane protein insertion porin family
MLPKKSLVVFFLLINFTCLWAQKYEIKSIYFENNNEISASRLKEIILSKESPAWAWKFLNSIWEKLGAQEIIFDSTKIPFDLAALGEYYRSLGYFETSFNYYYNLDTSKLIAELFYIINEGERSRFRNIYLFGLEEIPQVIYGKILQEYNTNTSDWFNQNVLEQNINSTLNILLNSGFMNARFDSTIIFRDTSANAADVNIFFTPGNLQTIDTILISKNGEGAYLVDEELLRKISGIKSGVLYNQDEIKRSQIRLYRTGLFNSVILIPDQLRNEEGKISLRLDGNIGYIHELSPEIIVNNHQSAFNIGLGANFIKKNFFGEARKFTFSTSFGIQDIFNVDFKSLIKQFSFRDTTLLGYVDARTIIEQPFLFGKPIFGTWENYANIKKQRDYNITAYGSKISFEFELPKYTILNYLSTSYNIEQTNEIYRTNNDSLSKKLVSTIGFDFGRSTTDDFLFPTMGMNLSFQIDEANGLPYAVAKLFGWKYDATIFYKILITASTYQAVDRKRNNIVALKFKTGYLKPYVGDYNGIPLNRTFYAGGSNSIRAWKANELVPSPTAVIQLFDRSIPSVKGGTFLMEGTFEYRYRFLQSFGLVGFFDYGNTWLNPKEFNFYEVALAAGLGVRYYTQVAPFRLDFGFKLYDPSDRAYIFGKKFWDNFEFHFGIGEAF